MKKIVNIIIVLSFALNITACNNSNAEKTKNSDKIKTKKVIKVYYFHSSHRCRTCVAVEEETKKALNELYPKEMKLGEITFQSVNIDEHKGEELANKMQISGQTLIFVQTNKTVNLTNEGFMYATTNPKKLKAKIKTTVEKLMKHPL